MARLDAAQAAAGRAVPLTTYVRAPPAADIARYAEAGFSQVVFWAHELCPPGARPVGPARRRGRRARRGRGSAAVTPSDRRPTRHAAGHSRASRSSRRRPGTGWRRGCRRRTDPDQRRGARAATTCRSSTGCRFDEERALLDRAMAWQQDKFDAGYGAITWPAEYGGAGLTGAHERAFNEVEAAFATPAGHETFSVTIAPGRADGRLFGTAEQRERFVRRFLRADELCCQLFSEPGAGSDLAGLATRAVRDGDEWVVNGQKVWSSGAQFAGWGELIARTDPTCPSTPGMTAFLIPLDAPGRRGPADPADVRRVVVQRGVPHRRPDPRRAAARRRRRRAGRSP